MGRPDKFNMLPKEFESMIKEYFEIEKTDRNNTGAMGIEYYLKCKK